MARRTDGATDRGGAPRRVGWPVAAVLAVPVAVALAAMGVLIAQVAGGALAGEPGSPREAPCAEAPAFGGAKLPAGASEARCTVRTWLDTDYEARFRMPRADVPGWLGAAYPDAPLARTPSCALDSADICLDLGLTEGDGNHAGRVPGRTDPGFGASAVQVTVKYEGPDQALVIFTAFTV